jgi:hypothetical protein
MARLRMIVPISIFLIFVILFDAFKSMRLAAIILMNVPFALIDPSVDRRAKSACPARTAYSPARVDIWLRVRDSRCPDT